MGTIQLKFKGISIKFERSDEEINKLFRQLSGGGTIESHSTQLKLLPTEEATNTSKTIPNPQDAEYYRPSTKEIMEYIKTLPQYRHSVKSVITHFNQKEIELVRKNELLYLYWFNIRQKLKNVRRKIEKIENGKWTEVRVSKGKEYYFEKI